MESRAEQQSAPTATPRAHLVGVCGAGMRALAAVLAARGWRLSGSDTRADLPVGLLPPGQFFPGHVAARLPADVELVIHTAAVDAEHAELRQARALGIPIRSYFEFLGELLRSGRGLAVAGTHGKSTTTAMLGAVLVAAGLDPTVILGAAPLDQATGGRAGRGARVLVEACEHQANFLHLHPQAAILTAIEPDHFDYYPSAAALDEAFTRFVRQIAPGGLLLCGDQPRARAVATRAVCRVETYGFAPEADWSIRTMRAFEGKYRFDLTHHGRLVLTADLRMPGRHNVHNAAAAAALACHEGVPAELVAHALGQFRGLHRRLERLGRWHGVEVVDDYAHHPTEVAAALAAVREMYPGRRTHCVFQPHQASRTAALLDEFAQSLQNAETVYVAEVFRAREPAPRQGEVTAADLARRLRASGAEAPALHGMADIEACLRRRLRAGDVLVVMGAGDIGRLARRMVEEPGTSPARPR